LVAEGIDWDEGNYAKCQKHGVTIAEIEHVLLHSDTVIIPVEGSGESRFVAIGLTPKGRFAFVVFTSRKRGSRLVTRPISARYMHAKEIKSYGQAVARLQERRGS
jgi:hypothetical protein